MRTWKFLAACAAAIVVACGGDDQMQENVVPAVTRDAQLLYTIEAGTEWIGAVGRDAQARASSSAARSFAATLAADHQGLQSAFANLVGQSELRPAESGAGQELITNAQTARVGLQSLQGADFDLAFVEGAIRLQQQLLSAIERDATVLQDSTLRRLAEQARPTLQAHIQRGRQLLPELRAAQAGASARTASNVPVTNPVMAPAEARQGEPDTTRTPRTSEPAAAEPAPPPADTSAVPPPVR